MHFRTHTKPESIGQSGRWQSEYHDAMIDHDKNVGTVLKAIDDAGIADNTFVMYCTDNGPHMNTWPDGGMTPFRNEKNSNWEGRLPGALHGPLAGQDQAGLGLERDRVAPRLAADAAGRWRATTRRQRRSCSRATRSADMTYKVHLDGYNLVPYLTGTGGEEPARVVPLLQRRPAGDRPAVRQLEARVHGTASSGHAAKSGPSRSSRCGSRRSSICGPIRTSGRTSPRTPTTTGCSTTSSCWCLPRTTWASS